MNVHSGDSPMPRSADSTSRTGTSPTLKFADPRYGDAVHDDRYRPTISHGARYTSGLMSVLKWPRSLRKTTAASTTAATAQATA